MFLFVFFLLKCFEIFKIIWSILLTCLISLELLFFFLSLSLSYISPYQPYTVHTIDIPNTYISYIHSYIWYTTDTYIHTYDARQIHTFIHMIYDRYIHTLPNNFILHHFSLPKTNVKETNTIKMRLISYEVHFLKRIMYLRRQN